MRDTMIIYRSFFEAIRELPKENQSEIWNAVYELGLNGIEIELQGLSKTIFMLVKPQIEANLKRFNNGKTPKKNQDKSKTEAKVKQEIIKVEANNNNNINNNKNKNVEERKNDFAYSLQPFVETYGREMLSEFFMHWSEPNQRKTKMKFEMEKTWSLEKRLMTWSKNSIKFGTAPSKAEKPKFDPYG